MAKATLTIEIEFDENVTDADAVGEAVDNLLDTALSTPGILDEDSTTIGQTYVLKEAKLPIHQWSNNELQFARLLSELSAAGVTDEQIQDCAVSMDLPRYRVVELFARAEQVFNEAKP